MPWRPSCVSKVSWCSLRLSLPAPRPNTDKRGLPQVEQHVLADRKWQPCGVCCRFGCLVTWSRDRTHTPQQPTSARAHAHPELCWNTTQPTGRAGLAAGAAVDDRKWRTDGRSDAAHAAWPGNISCNRSSLSGSGRLSGCCLPLHLPVALAQVEHLRTQERAVYAGGRSLSRSHTPERPDDL